MTRLTLFFSLIFFIGGCTDDVPTRLEGTKSDLAELSILVQKVRYPMRERYASIRKQMSELSSEERMELFRFFTETFEEPRFNDTTLAERQQSLEIYFDMVRSIGAIFNEVLDEHEMVWEFLLSTFDIFEQERTEISMSSYIPHTPSSGLHIDKSQYLFELDDIRDREIREFFEKGSFGRFFWDLSVDRQKEWLAWLDFVARRKVHVENRTLPQDGVPQSFVRLSPRLPRCIKAQHLRNTLTPSNPNTNSVVSCDEDL